MNKTDRNTDISVILPLFTNNNTVTNTINSILEQSFKNFELIIIGVDVCLFAYGCSIVSEQLVENTISPLN